MNAIASLHTHKKHFDINLDGAGGDGIFVDKQIDDTSPDIKNKIKQTYFRNSFRDSPDSVNNLFEYFKATNNNQFFYIYSRIRRFTIYGSILGHDFGIISRFPFLDHNLQEYIYSLPSDFDYNRIYREVLLDDFSDYFKIPSNNTGFRVFKSQKLNFIAKVISFFERKLGKQRYKNPYHNYKEWIKSNDDGLIDKYLRNQSLEIFNHIDYDFFQKKLTSFIDESANQAIISRALSLSIFLEHYSSKS